jgi:glycosyltransferase involved in cell wall biosynthesis
MAVASGESRHFIINGKFLADRTQGIVRYGREMTRELDDVPSDGVRLSLAVPTDAVDVPALSNIEVVPIGTRSGISWEQRDLAAWLRGHPETRCINFCNVAPLRAQPGITVVHDVMYRSCPEFYTTVRNRTSRRWHMLQYERIMSRELRIVTVSDFSRQEIERLYPQAKGKVSVIPGAWQHTQRYQQDAAWQEKFPDLLPGEFFFSLSTLARNKNGRWVIEAARRNPSRIFAIAGKNYDFDAANLPANVRLLGFVSDGEACALMRHCRAFLFPSLYEGFGLPPLEALSLGAQVIVANSSSLPEVFGGSAHYIDPLAEPPDLDALLAEPIAPAQDALARFSWSQSAAKLIDLLEEIPE